MKAMRRMGEMGTMAAVFVVEWMLARDKTDACMIGFVGGFALAAAMAFIFVRG